MDEYIRLDTTIIGIDNLISKASTAEEANALFKAKDVIYSQQRCLTDVQPVKHGRWIDFPECLEYFVCSECHHVWNTIDNCAETFRYCPNCGSKNEDGDSE